MNAYLLKSYRGHDGYTCPYSYIVNQLFSYNYDCPTGSKILKLKYQTMDGPVSKTETKTITVDEVEIEIPVTDCDYDNPKNHLAVLRNELTLLKLYIDGIDNGGLNKYKQEVDRRQNYYNIYVREDKDLCKFPYNQRPSYMKEEEIGDLYNRYHEKVNNDELEDVLDILDKIETKNYDEEIAEKDEVLELDEKKQEEDALYVFQMNEIRSELLWLLCYYYWCYGDYNEVWVPDTVYEKRKIIRNNHTTDPNSDGNAYVCVTEHTSSIDFSTDTLNWILVRENIDDKIHPFDRWYDWLLTGSDPYNEEDAVFKPAMRPDMAIMNFVAPRREIDCENLVGRPIDGGGYTYSNYDFLGNDLVNELGNWQMWGKEFNTKNDYLVPNPFISNPTDENWDPITYISSLELIPDKFEFVIKDGLHNKVTGCFSADDIVGDDNYSRFRFGLMCNLWAMLNFNNNELIQELEQVCKGKQKTEDEIQDKKAKKFVGIEIIMMYEGG
jgi:hypothetical protein